MTRYFKFMGDGTCWKEAPATEYKDGKTIIGYNKPSNEAMLLADGYVRYDGTCDMFHVKYENGQIVEIPTIPLMPTTFTKLQIRRAMRKLGIEDRLDFILNSNYEVQKDWNDALEINLNDPVFKLALTENGLNQELIDTIITNIEVTR